MQQDLGPLHLLECGAEASDQRVRKVADEADGIGQQYLAAAGELQLLQLGVERGKHAGGLKHPSVGERVEQRALAGVGVSDKRDDRDRHGFAALALLTADAPDGVELLLEMVDANVDLAAVGFEACFTGTTGSDAAAELRHGLAPASEPRKLVLELGQFDLQLALAGEGMAREDIEDELGTVYDPAGQPSFQIAELG